MLLHKHLTPELKARLDTLTTRHGWTLRKTIQSGLAHEDSQMGVYAGDSESYALFSPLLHPIIREHSGHDLSGQSSDFSLDGLPQDDLDPTGEFILSTRIRVGRNLARYAFPPAIGARDRAALEAEVVQVLSRLPGALAGEYHPLASLSEARREELVRRHILFQQADRFLDSAGVNRDWPRNRGLFHSADKRFIVWVGEEDALRIISMQPGSGLAAAFLRLKEALGQLDAHLDFARDSRLGFLTACPTNLGTAMRASVLIRLPYLSRRPDFHARCARLGLSVRGLHGEHSEPHDGIHDVSNAVRLGVTERDIYQRLRAGVQALMALEADARAAAARQRSRAG
ncbi:phosphagen kinase [Corallococcus macrosporus]|uniref:Arginine kinase n=1 Tax=Corallococcus macrosporus DSM 14697 TaxID=1189310 RepID=A0A250JSL2_9BACT|nr:phosphagen kinase [Corallococcus macrosporus]ATB46620.1 arginine kinase [Corallococcus macrosporus DSM 14697]